MRTATIFLTPMQHMHELKTGRDPTVPLVPAALRPAFVPAHSAPSGHPPGEKGTVTTVREREDVKSEIRLLGDREQCSGKLTISGGNCISQSDLTECNIFLTVCEAGMLPL